MRPLIILASAALALTACGDPLRGVERVSDGGVVLPDGPGSDLSRSVVATPEEPSGEAGLFSRLFGQRAADEGEPGGAVADAPDGAATQLADSEETPPRRSGLFGWLRSGETEPADVSVATRNEPGAEDAPAPSASRERRGLFGGLFSARAADHVDSVQTASLSPVSSGDARAGGGVLVPRSVPAPRNGPDKQVVRLGTILPFGEVARLCDARLRDYGKRIERAASGFTLHDSDPGSTAPRSFYVTGFADGCARQFTAALAMFGDPAMHEQLRYGLPSEKYPYSTTDKAYERVKSAVCGVPRRKPCGARIGSLSRNTVFISTYERFTDNGRWADILLHDGMVLAAAIKDL